MSEQKTLREFLEECNFGGYPIRVLDEAIKAFKRYLTQNLEKWENSEDDPEKMPNWHQRREAVIMEYRKLIKEADRK